MPSAHQRARELPVGRARRGRGGGVEPAQRIAHQHAAAHPAGPPALDEPEPGLARTPATISSRSSSTIPETITRSTSGGRRRGDVRVHGGRHVGGEGRRRRRRRSASRSASERLDRRRRCAAAFAIVASTPLCSWSIATTGPQPSSAAVIASTPVPQPRSANAPPGSRSQQQLEAHHGRRVRARAERAARAVDRPRRAALGRRGSAPEGRTTTRPPTAQAPRPVPRRRATGSSGASSSPDASSAGPTPASSASSGGSPVVP